MPRPAFPLLKFGSVFACAVACSSACGSDGAARPSTTGSEQDAAAGGQAGGAGSVATSTGGASGSSSDARAGAAPDGAILSPDGSSEASSVVGPGTYALGPPRQCDNQTYVQGCQWGMASTPCGGVCSAANACENLSGKPNAHVGFICPRFLLFGDEMAQAARDDWGTDSPPFGYAVVGHDQDTGGIDGNTGTCCQCYELVFDRPSPSMDNEACTNANCAMGSAVPVPPPLIVQAFNFGASTTTFDIFLGAGGFGANNACDPHGVPSSQSGQYMYTAFPTAGEPNGGGVKVSLQDSPWPAACKTSQNFITTATLGSTACQSLVMSECNKVQSASAIAAETIRSCVQSNAPSSFYHLNWQVYAKKVECPIHLTEVTGCKLAPQGLPAPAGITAAEASADPTWRVYGTTTMQDCCKPSCAWQDNVGGKGLRSVGQYNSFYTCDANGEPVTE